MHGKVFLEKDIRRELLMKIELMMNNSYSSNSGFRRKEIF